MKGFFAILGRAILWSLGTSLTVFAVAFIGPLLMGGPGAHQGPLGAFYFAPIAFRIVLPIGYILQYRRALDLDGAGKATYLVVLALILLQAVSPARIIAALDLSIDLAGYSREERLQHAPALNEQERSLRESTQLDLRVGVQNLRFPPVYTNKLVSDLDETGLFQVVKELAQMEDVDLVATVTGTYWGDKNGQRFTLRWAKDGSAEEEVRVYYTIGGIMSGAKDRRQYIDRLAIEVIQAVRALQTTSSE
jgi:hypothetical protein